MRGDFSAWNKDRSQNFRGTLHQQGRVLLDRDWNAQTEVIGEWQETAGRDAFGAGVAAVPAEVPNSFKVTKAEKITTAPAHVEVSVNKGRVWADGLLVESPADLVRTATYLNPPPGTVADLPNNLRDAVILETWLEELSPFQAPDLLIEPALGGVDTTERVQTAYRFRLFRMAAGETCDSIIPKLKDDFDAKGKLTAKLNDTQETDGDCPVVESGGYTGFEHRLYRVEIATQTEKPGSWFKWSQFNGGLVGRGVFDASAKKVEIRANQNAIAHCGISKFYLEALEFDTTLGCWQVIYGVNNVTLNADNTLTLPTAASNVFIGAIPPKTSGGKEKQHFFRLWNGIERVNDFTAAAGTDLPDKVGIKLTFELEGTGKYTPSDYWTFEVRVGQGVDSTTPPLVNNKAPQGIFYHRVPLAEVHWTGNVVTGDDIEDCRRIFQPLTKLKTCCTYRVGDGVHSHGDFTKIQAAINALPKSGGEVCILPGLYEENIVLSAPHNRNIILKGCGRRTIIKFKDDVAPIEPVIRVKSGQNIRIESLAVEAHQNGIGILLEGKELAAADTEKEKETYLKNIVMSDLFVTAAKNYAIKGHVAQFLTLSNSVIRIKENERDPSKVRVPAVYFAGDDLLIERCEIRVLPDRAKNEDHALSNDPGLFIEARQAHGGLQIGGGSERVRIINNLIVSGIGNGITLGSIDLQKGSKIKTNHDPFEPNGRDKDPCKPDPGHTDDGDVTDDGAKPIAGPPLYDILIKFNRIFNMGTNGIGVATFFSHGKIPVRYERDPVLMAASRGIISVSKLAITENRIEQCMNIAPQPIPDKMIHLMGFGGIALADTDGLVVRDNSIIDNGPDFLQPICGIFVLRSEGFEISRNHIINNGARTDDELTASAVKKGARGGIYIVNAVTPAVPITILMGGTGESRELETVPFSSGEPAAKIQENVVTVPLGRSLTIFATGAVSVVGNQFTSFGIQPLSLDDLIKMFKDAGGKLTAAIMMQLLDLLAGNVLIFDRGTPAWLPAQHASYTDVKMGNAANGASWAAKTNNLDNVNTAGINALKKFNRFFANGTVLFTNNQCHQNLATSEQSFAISSIFIASLDDIGFHNNQCDCDMERDFLLTNALLFGMTARVSDNRFRESIARVLFSAITLGILNVTTDNEAVHCIIVAGLVYLDKHNLILLEMFFGLTGDVTDVEARHVCDAFRKYLGGFGGRDKIGTVAPTSGVGDFGSFMAINMG